MARQDNRGIGRRKAGPSRSRKIDTVDWKDIALLRTFISDRGKVRARRVTGLSPRQQREVATAIRNAREMALLPYPSPTATATGRR
ncbi:MAG TPA: 30S ribosomal protein S18 [Pseudonocardia sp.]|jgi:small subunit ribosomal protein S18